jgi:hypothetical protein
MSLQWYNEFHSFSETLSLSLSLFPLLFLSYSTCVFPSLTFHYHRLLIHYIPCWVYYSQWSFVITDYSNISDRSTILYLNWTSI